MIQLLMVMGVYGDGSCVGGAAIDWSRDGNSFVLMVMVWFVSDDGRSDNRGNDVGGVMCRNQNGSDIIRVEMWECYLVIL